MRRPPAESAESLGWKTDAFGETSDTCEPKKSGLDGFRPVRGARLQLLSAQQEALSAMSAQDDRATRMPPRRIMCHQAGAIQTLPLLLVFGRAMP